MAADVMGKSNGQPDKTPPPPVIEEEPEWDETQAMVIELAGTSISAKIASEHQEKEKPVTEIVPPELHDLLDVFDEVAMSPDLPPHRPEFDCRIDLIPGAPLPKPGGLYAGSAADQALMKDWIDEHVAKGFIRPSRSPVASPCFFVGKKDGKGAWSSTIDP